MEIPGRILSFFRTAARGLQSQRIAMSTATENIANAGTTRTANGGPYAVKRAVHRVADEDYQRFGSLMRDMEMQLQSNGSAHFNRQAGGGSAGSLVGMDLGPETQVIEEARTRREYDPHHPHADAAGYVEYPDVNVVEEMARMVSANRLYEANLASIESGKNMIKRTLDI